MSRDIIREISSWTVSQKNCGTQGVGTIHGAIRKAGGRRQEPYSAIHKVAVRPAAVQNDLRRSFLLAAPIDSQLTFFCSTGIVPGKAGNGSAGGFVNSAVRRL